MKLLSKNMGTDSFPSWVLEKVSVRRLVGCVGRDGRPRGSHVPPESTHGDVHRSVRESPGASQTP